MLSNFLYIFIISYSFFCFYLLCNILIYNEMFDQVNKLSSKISESKREELGWGVLKNGY